jgi:hypothetical protein
MGIQEIKNRVLHLIAEKVIVKEHVDSETADTRFRVCLGCSARDEKQNVCGECGCFLDLKTGARTNWNAKRMRNEITHCPNGLWNDKEIANIYREMDGKELLT